MSEHICLHVGPGNALTSQIKIIRAFLNADEPAAQLCAGDSCCGTPHERIEDRFSGVGELRDPIHKKFEGFLGWMLAVLDIADPYRVMTTAIPVLLPFAVKDGNGFPAYAGSVACKLGCSIGLMPHPKAHERNSRLFQLCGMLPRAGHDYPALSLRDGIAAELDELLFGYSLKINLRHPQRPGRARSLMGLGVVRRIGQDHVHVAEGRHHEKRIPEDQ